VSAITPADEAWAESFLCRTQPQPGEWLAGYLLRIDKRNDFTAGEAIRASRRHGAGIAVTGRPGGLFSGRALDLALLARLAGARDVAEVETLTVAPVERWLFGDHRRTRLQAQHAGSFRVCPDCARNDHIPFATAFAEISACVPHGLRFVDRCSCEEPLLFFADQEPFTCHAPGCARPYGELERMRASAEELGEARRWNTAYGSLFTFAASSPAPLSWAELSRGLRHQFHRAGRSVADDVVLYQSLRKPNETSLRVIARILYRASATAEELDRAARDNGPLGRSGRTTRGFPRCPVPSCPDPSRVQRRTRPRRGRQTYYSCASCGARFTERRVCFAFDPAPGYPAWRVEKNRRLLAHYADAVSITCADFVRHHSRISQRSVFRAAGVPQSLGYFTQRAGLVQRVENAREAAAAGLDVRAATARSCGDCEDARKVGRGGSNSEAVQYP
jgi:hypothetical protein